MMDNFERAYREFNKFDETTRQNYVGKLALDRMAIRQEFGEDEPEPAVIERTREAPGNNGIALNIPSSFEDAHLFRLVA